MMSTLRSKHYFSIIPTRGWDIKDFSKTGQIRL